MATNGAEKAAAKNDFYVQAAITYGCVGAVQSMAVFWFFGPLLPAHPHGCCPCRYITLWIFLSAVVILVNKYLLAFAGFPFPIALTLSHMAFCSTLAFLIIKAGMVDTVHMDSSTYMRWVAAAARSSQCCGVVRRACQFKMGPSADRRNVVPIAALFSGTLWMGNAAYLYLSVAFIQMLKVGRLS